MTMISMIHSKASTLQFHKVQGSKFFGSRFPGRVARLQGCKRPSLAFHRVPWFQDLMTHEAAPHIKQRKIQTNTAKFKLIRTLAPYPATLRTLELSTLCMNLGASWLPRNLATLEPCSARFMPGLQQRPL